MLILTVCATFVDCQTGKHVSNTHTHTHCRTWSRPIKPPSIQPSCHPGFLASSVLWICVNFWLRAKGGTRVIPITCQPRKEKFSNCKTFIKTYSCPVFVSPKCHPHNWPKGCRLILHPQHPTPLLFFIRPQTPTISSIINAFHCRICRILHNTRALNNSRRI